MTSYNPNYDFNGHFKIFITTIITLLVIVLVSLLFNGCSPSRRMAKLLKKHPELIQTKDSTVIKLVPHDSLITIHGKTIYKDSLIPVIGPCPTIIHSETNAGASVHYTKHDSIIYLKCSCDSLQAIVTLLTRQISNYKQTVVTKTVAKPLNGYQSFCIWFVSIILILIVLYVGGRAFKLMPKIPGLPF